uniref:Uncharacterized protein n=1 Tax=Solanum lycopersicum TaxID=4081 RepID=A0A3Q7G7W8_SOLLC
MNGASHPSVFSVLPSIFLRHSIDKRRSTTIFSSEVASLISSIVLVRNYLDSRINGSEDIKVLTICNLTL